MVVPEGGLVLKGINTPGVEPVEHEEVHEDDEPQIGAAPLLLSNLLLLGNPHEGVNKSDGQHVADQNGCHRVKEGFCSAHGAYQPCDLIWKEVRYRVPMCR